MLVHVRCVHGAAAQVDEPAHHAHAAGVAPDAPGHAGGNHDATGPPSTPAGGYGKAVQAKRLLAGESMLLIQAACRSMCCTAAAACWAAKQRAYACWQVARAQMFVALHRLARRVPSCYVASKSERFRPPHVYEANTINMCINNTARVGSTSHECSVQMLQAHSDYNGSDIYNTCLHRVLLRVNNTGPPAAVLYDLPLGWWDNDWAECHDSRAAINDSQWRKVAGSFLAMHSRCVCRSPEVATSR
eukprot:GHRQ01024937.1.p1 GENE.GHRQ01024937.1~~GHRQ01024937.1.p1  ORF type:complete len:245 (+),score=28.13 GHRQ01024937.1:74-808(+)